MVVKATVIPILRATRKARMLHALKLMKGLLVAFFVELDLLSSAGQALIKL
jgi:hypothetical protein